MHFVLEDNFRILQTLYFCHAPFCTPCTPNLIIQEAAAADYSAQTGRAGVNASFPSERGILGGESKQRQRPISTIAKAAVIGVSWEESIKTLAY